MKRKNVILLLKKLGIFLDKKEESKYTYSECFTVIYLPYGK